VREVQEEMRSARLEAHIKQLTKVRVHIHSYVSGEILVRSSG
jgi:hypothetical protein